MADLVPEKITSFVVAVPGEDVVRELCVAQDDGPNLIVPHSPGM